MKKNVTLAYAAFAFSLGFLVLTGLAPDWGRWYSSAPYYREQTEALLRGSLAIQHTPTALRSDLAWHDGGVQQVWGLGVPLWRLPFELLARLCGQPAFPDHLAFGLALMVLVFVAGRILLSPPGGSLTPLNFAAVLVIALSPALVALCRLRFDVYEEPVAYGYLYSTGLFLGLVSFVRAPAPGKYLVLCSMAGLAPFIRPTIGAYSLVTVILLSFYSRKAGIGWGRCAVGVLLFAAGVGLLFLTNRIRFGSGFEFGHNLNFTGDAVQLFTRFYGPYAHESPLSAARELFGGLFGANWHSATPRWRQNYLPTFDWTYWLLPVAAATAWLCSRRFLAQKRLVLPPAAKAGWLWSGISFVILAAFYFRLPVMSSRYLLDFAPAFSAAIVAALLAFDGVALAIPGRRRWLSWCSLAFVVVWTTWELGTARGKFEPANVFKQDEAVRLALRAFNPAKPLPNAYRAGEDLANYGIFDNGLGWASDGSLGIISDFYVSDPQYLKLTLAPINPNMAVDFDRIQAKIGLEMLERESVVEQGDYRVITFKAPKRAVYRHGIQVIFLAYVDTTNLVMPFHSPLKLSRVEWRP